MARYGAIHKSETRRRIIEAASRRIKQDGIDRLPVDIKMHKGELQPEETCATG